MLDPLYNLSFLNAFGGLCAFWHQKVSKALCFHKKWYPLTSSPQIGKLLVNIVLEAAGKCSIYYMKHIVYWTIGTLFGSRHSEVSKSIRLSLKVDHVLPLCKTSKTASNVSFLELAEVLLKIPYKSVVYEYFWSHFCILAPESIQKALGFSL